MKQNIYDDPDFFAGYKAMRDANAGLNDVLEQPAIRSLLPSVLNKTILDLGCGEGYFCEYLVNGGATHVVGVDISTKMLGNANLRLSGHERITLVESSIEDFDAGQFEYDMVVSSLAFHYITDLNILFKRIHTCLKAHGVLVFSMEHPIVTCSQGIHTGWHKDASGEKIFWKVDAYSNEGIRRSHWIVDGVIKYHRTLSSIMNSLVNSGFVIEKISEPHSSAEAEKERPDLLEERRRPPFLLVRATKGNHDTD